MMILFIIVGLICLYLGAELMIMGGAALALRLGLPIIIIGLLIMGYGTGTPELVVSIQAGLAGKGDIVLGNVIGSNIANTGLILGLVAMLQPITINKRLVLSDGPVMGAAALALCGFFIFGKRITAIDGTLLLIALIVYTVWSIYNGKKTHKPEDEPHPHKMRSIWFEIFFVIGGLFLLILGGSLFLKGAIGIAKVYEISDRIIGLTVIALGTSLPELATSLVAVYKKHGDMAIGNVIGSNIFNILAIIGITALIEPMSVENIHWVDYTYMGVLMFGLWLIISKGTKISRWEGSLLFGSYVVYMCYLILI